MNKFKSKKGFTLAELLIVVAIIAVLVAIAVPLFVSGLKKAEDARDNANIHAVKSAAVVYILDHKKPAVGTADTIYQASGDLFTIFEVTAEIDKDGNIKITEVKGVTTETATFKEGCTAKTGDAKGYDVKARLKATELPTT